MSATFAVTRIALPAPQYARYAYPMHRSLLDGGDNAVAVGAVSGGEPIGLALGSVSSSPRIANVLSVAVAPGFRAQGVGTAMLQRLEHELAGYSSRATALFTDGSEYSEAVRRMLVRQGWGPIRPRMLICRSNRERILEAPWMHKFRLPPDFEIFEWRDLPAAEKEDIRTQRTIQYAELDSPFTEEESIEPFSSLGLRHKDTVVGWTITHILEPDTLRFTRMFVREDFQRLGRAVSLLAASIWRTTKQPLVERVSNAIFGIHVENVPMMHFAKRRFGPYSTAMYYSYGAAKTLACGREI